jgi:predicted TIM-barrel fold metal-dependent hydrolase
MKIRKSPPFFQRGCSCCGEPGGLFADNGLPSGGGSGGHRRIDVHHHVGPPKWLDEVIGRDLLQPATRNWTVAQSLEEMDRNGVSAAAVSITNPGLWFGDAAQTTRLARVSNDFMAQMVRDNPKRFAFFAAMPLPDADASLREIEYALDTLKADGIGLFTSYRDVWLGAEAFAPVMDELNRRKAKVFVHPTAAPCHMNLLPDVQPGVIEYGTDTTRAILGLLTSGQAVRFPDIKWIWSHAGGSAPFLAGRIEASVPRLKDHKTRLPNGAIHEMKRFFYDVAGASNRGALVSLMELVAISQVLFGTDYPAQKSADAITGLTGMKFSDAEMNAVNRENALRLLPRLA